MKLTLHKLKEGFIVTSDEPITMSDTLKDCYYLFKNEVVKREYTHPTESLKVIAQQDQIDFSTLSEEEQKEVGWFDVDKLALDRYPITQFEDEFDYRFRMGFNEGFRKAQELLSDNVCPTKELLDFINNEDNHTEGELGNSCIDVNTLINFVTQTKSWEVEVEMESKWIGHPDDFDNPHKEITVPKFNKSKLKILRIL